MPPLLLRLGLIVTLVLAGSGQRGLVLCVGAGVAVYLVVLRLAGLRLGDFWRLEHPGDGAGGQA